MHFEVEGCFKNLGHFKVLGLFFLFDFCFEHFEAEEYLENLGHFEVSGHAFKMLDTV